MSIHKSVSLSEFEWKQFNNLVEEHIKEIEPIIKHDDYHIYGLFSCDTTFSNNKNLKLINISVDNPYYKDEGTKMHKIIVLPIKINNSEFTKIKLELRNENKKQYNILNEEMLFCDTSNNKYFLNYESSDQSIKNKDKVAYILFTIEKVSRNLSFSHHYNLYVNSNKKALHKFEKIFVMSKRKNRNITPSKRKETKVIPKKKKRKTECGFTDSANDKSDTIFTIESFTDFIKITTDSLKRIESKVDQFQKDLNQFREDLNQLKKDQSNISNVNNISIRCFNDEYPNFDAILPSLGLEMEY